MSKIRSYRYKEIGYQYIVNRIYEPITCRNSNKYLLGYLIKRIILVEEAKNCEGEKNTDPDPDSMH